MGQSENLYNSVGGIVSRYLRSSRFPLEEMRPALNALLGERNALYDFTAGEETQRRQTLSLSNLNEKTGDRKDKGVYYTPQDVCNFILHNAIATLGGMNGRVLRESDAFTALSDLPQETVREIVFEKKFFDPTCGSGEFLLNVLRAKKALLGVLAEDADDGALLRIVETVYGNDIDPDSTDIAKLRLFFELCPDVRDAKTLLPIAKALSARFSNDDFVAYDGKFDGAFDCVVGNPPYVEYSKYEKRACLTHGYGNLYADVIRHSIDALRQGGALGFVIPLSYLSTARMSPIRAYVAERTEQEIVLSFADRPDCLFSGVHQKLNILFARKGKGHRLFTSGYRHWYKEERKDLFDGCEIAENLHATEEFVPKLGNAAEESVYRKICAFPRSIFDAQTADGQEIYLNLRGCFWIKAFTAPPSSKEYKLFRFGNDRSYVYCALNSGLFWLYWTAVSDGWHLTAKELKGFKLPDLPPRELAAFDALARKLEEKLELTKKFIGSKQADYEYKHRECKDVIDEIDDRLAALYGLSDGELHYVKNYALKYRMGSGADDKDH